MKILYRCLLVASLAFSAMSVQARPAIDASFDSSTYKSIDLNRQCRAQYSRFSYAIRTGDHAYDWRCNVNGAERNIDTTSACKAQWGSTYRPVLLGGHAYDWACTNWSGTTNKVIPVVVIASEYFHNISAIEDAVQTAARVTQNTQDWFKDEMNSGKTFKTVRPIVKLSLEPTSHWHDLSCLSGRPAPFNDRPSICADRTSPQARFDFFFEGRNEVSYLFDNKSSNTDIVVPVFIYTGNNSDAVRLGAASTRDTANKIAFSVQPPNVAACNLGDFWCGIYALGHETGHNFGLIHTDDLDPRPDNSTRSIMQTGGNKTTDMFLADAEQSALDSSSFFFSNLQARTFTNPMFNGYRLGYTNTNSAIRYASATEFCKSMGYRGWGGSPPSYANVGGSAYTYYQNNRWNVSGSYPVYATTRVHCIP